MPSRQKLLILITGPSGAGKTTLITALARSDPSIVQLPTTTTRKRRLNEVDGKDYHFVSRTDFENLVVKSEFLEWAEVYGSLYGLSKSSLRDVLSSGNDVVTAIGIAGIRPVVKRLNQITSEAVNIVSVFILPKSLSELESRLQTRAHIDRDEMYARLKLAESEIAQSHVCKYLIHSGSKDEDLNALMSIIAKERKASVV